MPIIRNIVIKYVIPHYRIITFAGFFAGRQGKKRPGRELPPSLHGYVSLLFPGGGEKSGIGHSGGNSGGN